jgi:hypothetical protein
MNRHFWRAAGLRSCAFLCPSHFGDRFSRRLAQNNAARIGHRGPVTAADGLGPLMEMAKSANEAGAVTD